MRSFKAFAFVTVASVLLAGSLQAQWIGEVQWAGVNGASSKYRNLDQSKTWNVYTSPYFAQFKIPLNSPASALLPPAGTDGFGPKWDIFCVDFNHYANTGTYGAYFTNLSSSPADLAKTRLGAGGIWQYLAAAYLSQKIREFGVGTDAAKDMNGAIWQIMSGDPIFRNTVGTTYSRDGIDRWVGEAWTNVLAGNVNASNWVVVTDVASVGPNGGSQEYITQVTPEPATMLLLGTGLVVMLLAAGALRRPTA